MVDVVDFAFFFVVDFVVDVVDVVYVVVCGRCGRFCSCFCACLYSIVICFVLQVLQCSISATSLQGPFFFPVIKLMVQVLK